MGCYCFVVADKKPDPGAERRRMERKAEEERRRPKPSREVSLWWLEQKAKEKYGGGKKAPKSPGRTPFPSPPPKGKEKENASVGDALKGLTSESGTSSLLKGMLRYMSGK